MIQQKTFFNKMRELGINFLTGVPDSLLNEFCLYAQTKYSSHEHIIAANEGNAVAIASGYNLASGEIPLVYMQNSGIGNSMNPLLSLTNKEVYSIPMVLLIGWRGNPDEGDWAQHKQQGILTPILMENMNIPHRTISSANDGVDELDWAYKTAQRLNSPVAIFASKGQFEQGKKNRIEESDVLELSREQAITAVVQSIPSDAIVVATTGRASRELYEVREALGDSHENDFLNVGAMGHTSQIALGLAIASPKRKVICLDGDAALLMHMGGMAISGNSAVSNLIHIVLNNGVHESVGGQPSVGFKVDFTSIANASGFNTQQSSIVSKDEIERVLKSILNNNSLSAPSFIDIHIKKGMRADMPPLKVDHKELKNKLTESIRPKKNHI
ncbi:phosphonopyruvate decarboxylase [Idiomarina sp. Sol25]|uniref:phosphonopyruvate decarboxylase n=1 Tax=Idiomarina sp. Sol25 TaxID=3064000 RepID=UPI00294B9240|nr:phosphonopyruvate decarboxylase [Idiomarina sp. Sol25]MDV6328045.1 phosphonopyruvate decarboxylase [Idiomarina sp. Sol25]